MRFVIKVYYYFLSYKGRFWTECVIATDYDNYWIQYECEVNKEGILVETVVTRSRRRHITPTEKAIYMSIVEGLGFPRINFVDVPQPSSCNRDASSYHQDKPKLPKIPFWFGNEFIAN